MRLSEGKLSKTSRSSFNAMSYISPACSMKHNCFEISYNLTNKTSIQSNVQQQQIIFTCEFTDLNQIIYNLTNKTSILSNVQQQKIIFTCEFTDLNKIIVVITLSLKQYTGIEDN